jgi:hypothetical protein
MGRGGVITEFLLGSLKAGDHWEDISVGGRITLRWTLGLNWIQLAQNKVQRWAFEDTVMNLRVP